MNDTKDIEKLFNAASIEDMTMPATKEVIRNLVLHLGYSAVKPEKRWLSLWKIIIILSGCFSIAVIGFYLTIEDNETPGQINALGGVWSTYNDSLSGGSSTVWPPVSSMCRNNFVKSAPGYGGKGYAVMMKGTAGLTDSAYAGVKTFLGERAACPRCTGIDLTMYRGIRFKMKGRAGAGKLLFILPHLSSQPASDMSACLSLSGNRDYHADLTGRLTPDWKEIALEFRRDFTLPGALTGFRSEDISKVLENAMCIQWHWIGEYGKSIELWIDDVEVY